MIELPAQIEFSAWVRIVERLSNASNAKNGNAPRFRGDGARILRVIEALQAFVKGAAKSIHLGRHE